VWKKKFLRDSIHVIREEGKLPCNWDGEKICRWINSRTGGIPGRELNRETNTNKRDRCQPAYEPRGDSGLVCGREEGGGRVVWVSRGTRGKGETVVGERSLPLKLVGGFNQFSKKA